MPTPAAFFDSVRLGLLGPTLSQDEVGGCNAILLAAQDAQWPLAYVAYAIATAYHETAGTMQPIKERGGAAYLRRMYDVEGARPTLARKHGNLTPGDGVKYAGRGYVQLTWRCNYERADQELALKGALIRNPDLAMRPDIAAAVMIRGMSEGWFTGRKLSHYLPKTGPAIRSQFVVSRKIINGLDCADQIAGHAMAFQDALQAGGWA